jgi:hypothetical protein
MQNPSKLSFFWRGVWLKVHSFIHSFFVESLFIKTLHQFVLNVIGAYLTQGILQYILVGLSILIWATIVGFDSWWYISYMTSDYGCKDTSHFGWIYLPPPLSSICIDVTNSTCIHFQFLPLKKPIQCGSIHQYN